MIDLFRVAFNLLHNYPSTDDLDRSIAPAPSLSTFPSLEQCPLCLKSYPLSELVAHSETCGDSKSGEADTREELSREMLERDVATVRGCRTSEKENELDGPSPVLPSGRGGDDLEKDCSRKYDLEPASPIALRPPSEAAIHSPVSDSTVPAGAVGVSYPRAKQTMVGADNGSLEQGSSSDIEQCMYCWEDFPVADLVAHSECCPMKTESKVRRCICTLSPYCAQLLILALDLFIIRTLHYHRVLCISAPDMLPSTHHYVARQILCS